MAIEQVEGIILHTLDYQDYDQIITVFSKEEGMIKFIIKGAKSYQKRQGITTAPLTRAEFLYTRGKSDLWKCQEMTILDYQLALRNNLVYLQTAFDFVKALQATQTGSKPAPELYQLLTIYLGRLPLSRGPANLAASFRLKLLCHEGVFTVEEAHFFHQKEKEIVEILAYSRSIGDIDSLEISPELALKIQSYFVSSL